MKRVLPLLAIVTVLALLAAPRPAAQPEGSTPLDSGLRTGAPQAQPSARDSQGFEVGTPFDSGVPVLSGSGAPHPTAMLGDYSSAINPKLTPEPRPTPRVVVSKGSGLSGQATWWFSFGHGLYAALRPDLGTKGDLAIVCGGTPYHCLSLPVITTCACLGPGSDRLIDLSRDAFESFAPASRGTIHIVLQVVKGGAP